MKKKIVWASIALPLSLVFCPLPSLAADATSFDPTKVQITAKSISSIPVGTVVTWPSGANPADMQNPDGTYNWLECNGQSISQTVYPELFAVIGGKVPDYRGLFLRGYGQQTHTQNNGSAVGVTSTTHKSGELGKVQGDAIRNIWGKFSTETPSREMSDLFTQYDGPGDGNGDDGHSGDPRIIFDASRVVPTATENRPVNVAVRYFIRAR